MMISLPDDPNQRATAVQKWKCSVCGHVYDPATGDPEGGVAPPAPFEKVPDDWTCPECGAAKSAYRPM